MFRFAAAALIAAAAALATSPAEAQGARNTQARVGQSALMTGPGGCEGYNRAVAEAVATQLRRGDRAEARRLATLAQSCGR